MTPRDQTAETSVRRLRVTIEPVPGDRRELNFDAPFRIGRVDDCEVCIKNEYVSRAHVQVSIENGTWVARDLGSSNGVFVNGARTPEVRITRQTSVRLGIQGPVVVLEPEPLPPPKPKPALPAEASEGTVVAQYVDHYFKNNPDRPAGDHTIMVRKAFQQVQTRQKRKYGWIIGALAALMLGIGGYAFYLHQQVARQMSVAKDIFYSMKSLDVDIASVQKLVLDSRNPEAAAQISKYQDRRKEMQKNYDQFLSNLHVYDKKMTEEERLILRIARIFGECELAMPPGFVPEVQSYIKKWQSSGRLASGIRKAKTQGYTQVITKSLLDQGLPPQFFYLALQESDFEPYISGPPTRMGIAKGMWQFIPDTAVKYGLRIGPLADFRRPDPSDDRHHWDRETVAATRYLKDLYSTDAQASGLLVMACYNWGENQVLPLVRSMPANPKDRNFWQLLTKYREKIPDETYKYVFYITSAAVIGENPRMFGFDFDDPLGHLEGH